jgi:type I restriction enzyme M protein
MAREVLPHVPDAWVDMAKTKVGYEIPFTRHFYRPPHVRDLHDIGREIRELQSTLDDLLSKVLP